MRGRPLSLTAELQRVNVETNLSIETTDIVRGLDMIRTADPRKLFRTRKVRGRLVEEIKPITELDDATALAIKSVRMGPNGPEVTFHDKIAASRLIGLHLGMFQGESAGNVPVSNAIIDNSQKTVVYVDGPPRETLEQWQARVAKERGIKLLEQPKP